MKYTLFILALLASLSSCQETNPSTPYQVEMPDRLDTLVDIDQYYILIDEEGDNITYDTVRNEIPKVRKIFREGVAYVYRATYQNADGEVITDNTITLTPSGERISFAPLKQDRIDIKIDYTEAEKEYILNQHPRRFRFVKSAVDR